MPYELMYVPIVSSYVLMTLTCRTMTRMLDVFLGIPLFPNAPRCSFARKKACEHIVAAVEMDFRFRAMYNHSGGIGGLRRGFCRLQKDNERLLKRTNFVISRYMPLNKDRFGQLFAVVYKQSQLFLNSEVGVVGLVAEGSLPSEGLDLSIDAIRTPLERSVPATAVLTRSRLRGWREDGGVQEELWLPDTFISQVHFDLLSTIIYTSKKKCWYRKPQSGSSEKFCFPVKTRDRDVCLLFLALTRVLPLIQLIETD